MGVWSSLFQTSYWERKLFHPTLGLFYLKRHYILMNVMLSALPAFFNPSFFHNQSSDRNNIFVFFGEKLTNDSNRDINWIFQLQPWKLRTRWHFCSSSYYKMMFSIFAVVHNTWETTGSCFCFVLTLSLSHICLPYQWSNSPFLC